MRLLLALATALALALASSTPLSEDQFQFLFTRFAAQYGRQYATGAFFSKYNTFKQNVNAVMAHNAGNHSYTMAINEFGDLSFDEFSARFGLKSVGTVDSPATPPPAPRAPAKRVFRDIPAKVDWREKNVVSAIKQQGHCGSCWAFSATAAIEGAIAIAGGPLYDLSESQLMDCGRDFGNYGCEGGLVDRAFDYVKARGGLCETKDYPYQPKDGPCAETSCARTTPIVAYKKLETVGQVELDAALTQNVVAVSVCANSNFQFYSGGVFRGPCGRKLNHAVALVGYDTTSEKPVYHLRNSWGTSWGEQGYMRFSKGTWCGLGLDSYYVLV
jgi:hypothetical protein